MMKPPMAPAPLRSTGLIRALPSVILLGLAGFAASGAQAQSMSASSAQYNAGYGHAAGQENQPVNVSMRDANGNLVVAGGQLLSPTGTSVFSSMSMGAGSSATGVGVGATAVGNSLSVVTTGSYNTVIVNSVQTNTGNVTATTTAHGVGDGQ